MYPMNFLPRGPFPSWGWGCRDGDPSIVLGIVIVLEKCGGHGVRTRQPPPHHRQGRERRLVLLRTKEKKPP